MSTTDQPVAETVSEPQPYEWMFSECRDDHLLDELKQVRENIEGLAETKAVFKVTQVYDDGNDDARGAPAAMPDLLRFLGAWKSPERFLGGQVRGDNWVNPHGKWSPKYSDVAAICECGAVRFSPEFKADSESTYLDEKYSEPCKPDCPADARHRTKTEIWENRREILEVAGTYCHPTEMVARRLDVANYNIHEVAMNLSLGRYTQLYQWGQRRQRATWVRLNEEYGATHKEIADAFGEHRSTISDHINRRPKFYDEPQQCPW